MSLCITSSSMSDTTEIPTWSVEDVVVIIQVKEPRKHSRTSRST
jgi:hypothetical protein